MTERIQSSLDYLTPAEFKATLVDIQPNSLLKNA